MVVYDYDNGLTVVMNSGLKLTVKLMVPKGVDYGWEVTGCDLGKLRQFKRVTFESKNPRFDFQVFQFRTMGRGKADLELRYIRPLEKYNPPLRRFCLTVDIR